MAYVLGFFAADGSMLENNRGAHYIEFHITDKKILEQMREAMGSNHKIKERKRDEKWKPIYRLQIGSKVFYEDLQKHGFTQAKSHTLKLPLVPKKYIADFVRGYFDGDGCVHFKQYKVRGRKKPKWVFQTRFTSGSKNFLQDLHNLLKDYGVARGFITKKNRGHELVFSHRDGVALYRLMYNNTPRIYLKRKYNIFRKAMKTLYGE